MERTCAFPKTPNKHAKALQIEKFTLWYSRNLGAHRVPWWWAWSWIHKSWLPQWKGHLRNRAYPGSRLTCAHCLCRQRKLSGKGWLAQGGPPDSVWSMAIASIHPCGQRASPELETWTWMELSLLRHNSVPRIQEYNPQPGKASPTLENCWLFTLKSYTNQMQITLKRKLASQLNYPISILFFSNFPEPQDTGWVLKRSLFVSLVKISSLYSPLFCGINSIFLVYK